MLAGSECTRTRSPDQQQGPPLHIVLLCSTTKRAPLEKLCEGGKRALLFVCVLNVLYPLRLLWIRNTACLAQEAVKEEQRARWAAEAHLQPHASADGGHAGGEHEAAAEQEEVRAAQAERKMLADEVQALTNELRSVQARRGHAGAGNPMAVQ